MLLRGVEGRRNEFLGKDLRAGYVKYLSTLNLSRRIIDSNRRSGVYGEICRESFFFPASLILVQDEVITCIW